jgi:hypothetical protein
MTNGIDVIGDIHGQAEMLVALLKAMEYFEHDGVWQHPERTAMFIGDLIDRNPGQLEVIDIARRMVDADAAHIVMGNHEFNAIAWAADLRERSEKNFEQHRMFLAEVEEGSARHREIIEWFRTIPLWCEVGGARFVHACWDPHAIEVLTKTGYDGSRLDDELIAAAATKPPKRDDGSSPAFGPYQAVEHLLKGPEVKLPEGYEYLDKGGHPRCHARIAWWQNDISTYRKAALIPEGTTHRDGTPYRGLPDDPVHDLPVSPYCDTEPPLFVGHYWMTGSPEVLCPHVACVDYSAGKTGDLVAYRWDGEPMLSNDKFVSIRR